MASTTTTKEEEESSTAQEGKGAPHQRRMGMQHHPKQHCQRGEKGEQYHPRGREQHHRSFGLGDVTVFDNWDGNPFLGDVAFPLGSFVVLCFSSSSFGVLSSSRPLGRCCISRSHSWVVVLPSSSVLLGGAAFSTSFLWVLPAFSLSLVCGAVVPFSFNWVVQKKFIQKI